MTCETAPCQFRRLAPQKKTSFVCRIFATQLRPSLLLDPPHLWPRGASPARGGGSRPPPQAHRAKVPGAEKNVERFSSRNVGFNQGLEIKTQKPRRVVLMTALARERTHRDVANTYSLKFLKVNVQRKFSRLGALTLSSNQTFLKMEGFKALGFYIHSLAKYCVHRPHNLSKSFRSGKSRGLYAD